MTGSICGKQNGVALVLVLWMLGLMTIMAGSYSLSTHREAELLQHAHERTKALALADAGVHYAMLMLNLPDIKTRWRTDGEPYYWEAGGVRIRISIFDEAGKIDLNAIQEMGLRKLLTLILQNPDKALQLTDVILDWRDTDNLKRANGAEAEDYRAMGLNQPPRNRNFLAMEEFRSIMGMTPEIYQKLEPWFTLYTGQQGLNPLKATRPILLILNGNDVAAVDNYLRQRRQVAVGMPNAAPSPMGTQTGFTQQAASDMAYTIYSQPEIAGQPPVRIQATIKRNGANVMEPFLFISWKETGVAGKPQSIDSNAVTH